MSARVIGICQTCGREASSPLVSKQCQVCLLGAGFLHTPEQGDARDGVPLGRVGDYDLLEEIARGGMGVVYRARQATLSREVAVKMILTGRLSSTDAVDRFLTEAKAVARLDHPNIISVYEVGELEGDYFFSMQLVNGGNLAQCMQTLALPNAGPSRSDADRCQHDIAELMAKLAQALGYAHGRGVLHRDLKPANVLIDEAWEPLLTDFGLAKITDDEGDDLTRTLAVFGSPVYMAPEQARGGAKNVTTAADVYGLGAVLYELLCGRRLFRGTSTMETLHKVMHEEPQPIMDQQPRANADLATICHKCLEKEPRRRYASALELEEDLRRYLRREPVLARPVSSLGRVTRWADRNPWLAALSLMIAMVSVVGAAGVLWQWTLANKANVGLTESVERLEWRHVNTLLDQDKSQRAVARLAQWIRREPDHWRAATYAMSILEQHVFPQPLGLPMVDTGKARGVVPQLSPDGKFVAIALPESGVTLYDTQSGESRLVCQDIWVDSVAFHPHEPFLVATTNNRIVAYHTGTSSSKAWELTVPGWSHELLISPDGSRVVAKFRDAVRVWGWPRGNMAPAALATLECGHEISGMRIDGRGRRVAAWSPVAGIPLMLWTVGWDGSVEETAFHAPRIRMADLSADGSRIAASTGLYQFRVWPTNDPRRWIEDNEIRGIIGALALSPDGRKVYATGRHGLAHSWDTTTGALLRSEMEHQYDIPSIEIGSENERIVTGSWDHSSRIWDVHTGRPLCARMLHDDDVQRAAMSVDGSRVLTLSGEIQTQAQIWHIPAKPEPKIYSPPGGRDMYAVVLSPSQQWVAVGTDDEGANNIMTVSKKGGGVIFQSEPVNGGIYGALFTPDESQFLVVSSGGSIYSWSVGTWEPTRPPLHFNVETISAIMSPDGSFFATGSADGKVRVWNLPDGSLRHTLTHGGNIMGLDVSRFSDRIVSASQDHTAKVWDSQSGEEICHFSQHDRAVLCVHFSPDAGRVLSASYDSTARVWDAETAKELTPPLRHRGELANARFHPDGTMVASGSRDGVLRLWDAADGTPLANPILLSAPVRTIRFSPDGERLLVVDHNGARVWDVASREPLTVQFNHPIASGLGVDTPCMRESFTADGNQILLGISSDQARFWNIPNASPDIPDWFTQFLEVIAGLRFDEFDQVQLVTPKESLELRHRLQEDTGGGPYLAWAQNYLKR